MWKKIVLGSSLVLSLACVAPAFADMHSRVWCERHPVECHNHYANRDLYCRHNPESCRGYHHRRMWNDRREMNDRRDMRDMNDRRDMQGYQR